MTAPTSSAPVSPAPASPAPASPLPTSSLPAQSRRNARLRVKSESRATGHVDGAWWPCSRDLAAELPELLTALGSQWGPWERVTYNLTMWEPAARKLTVGDSRIRLEGFRSQQRETVTVVGGYGHVRLTLLVVPPEAAPASARASLAAASQGGNTDGIDSLLGSGDSADAEESEESAERWELDGGRVR
ncbi:DUF5994 family protein [Prauserella halophila]|nr:DUF5994 family protein [Prauserella halophila]